VKNIAYLFALAAGVLTVSGCSSWFGGNKTEKPVVTAENEAPRGEEMAQGDDRRNEERAGEEMAKHGEDRRNEERAGEEMAKHGEDRRNEERAGEEMAKHGEDRRSEEKHGEEMASAATTQTVAATAMPMNEEKAA
jgi:hypothetical protein